MPPKAISILSIIARLFARDLLKGLVEVRGTAKAAGGGDLQLGEVRFLQHSDGALHPFDGEERCVHQFQEFPKRTYAFIFPIAENYHLRMANTHAIKPQKFFKMEESFHL